MPNKGKVKSVTHRRNHILDMMLQGKTTADIRKWFKENHNRLTEHSMEKDITYCYAELKKYVHLNMEDIINEHVMFYDDIAMNAKEAYFYDQAIKAKQAKEKLLGMHKPETQVNVQNNSVNLDLKDISLEELKKLMNG